MSKGIPKEYLMPDASSFNDGDLDFVVDLAVRAGTLAAEMRQGVGVHQKSGPGDLVTDADLALSKLIMSELAQRFPDDMLISEEEPPSSELRAHLEISGNRVWLIDPIDGTDNYVRNDGEYSIMLGLLRDSKPFFGCFYCPAVNLGYAGGSQTGVYRFDASKAKTLAKSPLTGEIGPKARLMVGWRDRRRHSWIGAIPDIEWIVAGSVGLKVAKVLQNEADMFVHLSSRLKLWDTAGPVAVALAAGMEVGTLEENEDELSFPLPAVQHNCTVVIGRAGSLNWARQRLSNKSRDSKFPPTVNTIS